LVKTITTKEYFNMNATNIVNLIPDGATPQLPGTEWTVRSLTLTDERGLLAEGEVVADNSENERKVAANWNAKYLAPNLWRIEGSGAINATGKTTDMPVQYPFSFQAGVNDGIKLLLRQALEERRSGRKLAVVSQNSKTPVERETPTDAPDEKPSEEQVSPAQKPRGQREPRAPKADESPPETPPPQPPPEKYNVG